MCACQRVFRASGRSAQLGNVWTWGIKTKHIKTMILSNAFLEWYFYFCLIVRWIVFRRQYRQDVIINVEKCSSFVLSLKIVLTLNIDFSNKVMWLFTVEPSGSQIIYRKTSNIRRTLARNKIVDHSDVVGALPVGAAPTTSSFSTWHLASRDSAKTVARQYENILSVEIWCVLYERLDGNMRKSAHCLQYCYGGCWRGFRNTLGQIAVCWK